MPKRRYSIGNYPATWQEIATDVKAAADWKCIRCGHKHDPENGYCLTVHHMNMDPSNNRWWNLLALCQRCHLHVQAKVIIERPFIFEHSDWFKPYVAGYYAWLHGIRDDKDYVLENIDQLLDFGRPVRKHDQDGILLSGIAS
jgi:hypothetical protein